MSWKVTLSQFLSDGFNKHRTKATGTVAEGLAGWKGKIHRGLENENHHRGWAWTMKKCSSLFIEYSEFSRGRFLHSQLQGSHHQTSISTHSGIDSATAISLGKKGQKPSREHWYSRQAHPQRQSPPSMLHARCALWMHVFLTPAQGAQD